MSRRKPETLPARPQGIMSLAGRRTKPCPICSRPSDVAFHPFCSARCTDIDLHRWLGGGYALPTTAVEDDEGESQLDRDDESS